MPKRSLRVLRITGSVLLFTAIFLTIVGGCTGESSTIVPYIPPDYYACLEAAPDVLLSSYFSVTYGNLSLANQRFTDMPFVFKRIVVDQRMLMDKDKDIFEVSTIRCMALQRGAIAKLKVGDTIDIVGMNRGALLDMPGWLIMADCMFLPAGIVQLPAPGGAVFTPAY